MNISFNNTVIIYTKGLVTLHGCTLHGSTWFFIYKSQYETDFTYKTADIIPLSIKNKMINIINTSVNDYLEMFHSSGIRSISIISVLEVVAGNESVKTVNSCHLTVLNISIINTTFTNYVIRYMAYGRDSIISMKTIHSKFNKSSVQQLKGEGFLGAIIEDNKFYNSVVGFLQVISVRMRTCDYEVRDNKYGDNVKIIGNDHFYYKPEGIQKTINLLNCLPSHCEHYWSTVSIQNTLFSGSLDKQTNNL